MRRTILTVLAVLLGSMAASALDTGTVSVASQELTSVRKYTITWTAGTNNICSGDIRLLDGELLRAEFAAGSPTGSNNYDVALVDRNNVDLLGGTGTNLSVTTALTVCPGIVVTNVANGNGVATMRPVALAEILRLDVHNPSNSASGTVTLYLR